MQTFYKPRQKLVALLILGFLRILSTLIAAAFLPSGYALPVTRIYGDDYRIFQSVLGTPLIGLSLLVVFWISRKVMREKTNLLEPAQEDTDSQFETLHIIDLLKPLFPVGCIFFVVLLFACSTLSTIWVHLGYDKVPLFISSHPSTTFVPVSGFYGPGTWLALLGTAVVMMVPLVRGAVSQTPPTTWSAELVTLLVYTLTASYDLFSKHDAIFKEHDRIDVTLFPALVAATRATAFGAGILEISAILLLISHNQDNSYVATFQLLLAWGSSVVALVVMCPLTKAWDCEQDGQSCISLAPSHTFLVRQHRDSIGEMREIVLAFYPSQLPLFVNDHRTSFKVLAAFMGLMGLTGFTIALVIGLRAAMKLARVPLAMVPAFALTSAFACVSALAFFYFTPLITFIVTLLMLDIAIYPLIYLVSLLPVLVLSAVPGQSLSPYSGISIREIDQMSALLALIIYTIFQHGHHILSIVLYLKTVVRSRTRRPEDEQIDLEEALPSESSP
ncbi:hypothetical protein DL96DRAFT_1716412 [Flagelloscypha sp. PMI_526]|nr:hypothetical protein DL96DRAFT_1716412 [Flagelloscypha sp. PMI_526]